ncbi:MAG: hypothetical protein CMQ37_10885 [Gammaproteobacteria bacterium]|nr:hypothetical protein [Gammaproteobacteria bacterium]
MTSLRLPVGQTQARIITNNTSEQELDLSLHLYARNTVGCARIEQFLRPCICRLDQAKKTE